MSTPLDLTAKYQLEQVLSWTGLGRTFRGRHPKTRAPVAVKVLSLARTPSSDVLGQRFLMTGRVLSSLTHHTLPEVIDYGLSSTGDAYLVTSWFEGEPLTRMAPLEPRDLLGMIIQLTQGLESLALHGLVHLNLTPDNILVNERQPRLTGWGHSLLTVDWQSAPGPPDSQPNAFTAPELCESRKAGDALWRADLYSLGAITASLLGAELERNEHGLTVRFQRELSAQLQQPELLRGVLERCLLLDATQRLDSYSELARAIQHAMPRGRGADRNVSDTQPLEKIQPQDVEQVARRLEEEQGDASEGRRVGDRTGARRELFDLRTLNPELSATAPVPKLDQEMAQELTHRLEELEQTTIIDSGSRGKSAPPPVPPPAPPEAQADDVAPAPETGTSTEDLDTGPIDPTLIQSVRLQAQSSDAPAIDPTLITTAGDLAAAAQGEASPGSPADEEPDLDLTSTRVFPVVQAGIATPVPESASDEGAHASAPSADESEGEDAAVSALGIDDDVPYDSEDPTVIVRSDAVFKIRSGVLPSQGEVEDRHDPPAAPATVPPPAPPASPSSPDQEVTAALEAEASGTEEPRPAVTPPPQEPPSPPAPPEGLDASPEAPPAERPPAKPSEAETTAEAHDTPSAEGLFDEPAAAKSKSKRAAAASAGAETKPAKNKAPASGTPAQVDEGPRVPVALLAAAGVVVVVLLLSGAWFILRSGGDESETRVETPIAAPVRAAEAEQPAQVGSEPVELPVPLLDALELFVNEEFLAARGALQEVADMVEAGELPPEVCSAYLALDESVLRARVDVVAVDLGRRLQGGEASPLRRLLGSVDARERQELNRVDANRRNLDEADRAVAAVADFERAERTGEPVPLLEAADALAIAHPRFAEVLSARERSAVAVETRAAEMEQNGQLEESISLLERLLDLRPGRSGAQQRIGAIRQRMRSSERFDTLAQAMERASANGRPSDGLSMMQGVEIPEGQLGRFRGLQARLETQLAELDGEAPAIGMVLSPEELEFRRGDAVVLEFSIGDDYEVRGARLNLRNSNGQVQAHDLDVIGERADFTVPADFHGDRTFEIWVTATDISANVGLLGSEQEPVEIRRRRWFRR